MNRRLFTVQEANELIPFLTDRLGALGSVHRQLCSLAPGETPRFQDVMAAGGMPVGLVYFRLASKLQCLVREINAQGAQIKDLEKGLVDFPTLWEGREVYLCWQLGEDEVGFWHEVDAGYAGRQPLKTGP